MLETIYVEDAVASHPRAQSILSRFPKATAIPVTRCGEVFNRNRQNFRLQKRKPSVSYPAELETAMRESCEEELGRFVPSSILFPCRI